jgi:hypothetical protein
MKKIEIFTIVLNGISYIKYHLKEFEKLQIPWTWYIIEGVAELKNDTAWSVASGGNIPKKFHTDKYLSIDGTTEYIKGKVNVLQRLGRKDWETIRLYIQKNNGFIPRAKAVIRRMPKDFRC